MKVDSLALKAYNEIRKKILSQQLAANTRLKEDEWAGKIEVSRMAIREALNRLLGEGMLIVGDKGGYFVKPITIADVNQIRELREILEIGALKIAASETSRADGTTKYVFALGDGNMIEAVLIPSEARNDEHLPKRQTVCVSTQVGCALDCKFCATASMKVKRDLTVFEIMDQFFQIENSDLKTGQVYQFFDCADCAQEIVKAAESIFFVARCAYFNSLKWNQFQFYQFGSSLDVAFL